MTLVNCGLKGLCYSMCSLIIVSMFNIGCCFESYVNHNPVKKHFTLIWVHNTCVSSYLFSELIALFFKKAFFEGDFEMSSVISCDEFSIPCVVYKLWCYNSYFLAYQELVCFYG